MNPSDTVREVWDDFYRNDTATSEQLLRGLVSSKVARYDTFDYTEGLERKGEENNTIILEDIAEDIDEEVVGYFTEYIFSDGALVNRTIDDNNLNNLNVTNVTYIGRWIHSTDCGDLTTQTVPTTPHVLSF